jgi:hypothetical protein
MSRSRKDDVDAAARALSRAPRSVQEGLANGVLACCIFICGSGVLGIYECILSEDPHEPCSTFDEHESTCTAAAHGCKVITHTLNGSHPIHMVSSERSHRSHHRVARP